MRRTIFVLMGMLLLAFQQAAHAQGAAASGAAAQNEGPIRTLLAKQQEMQLTPDQVARLEALQLQLEARNQPMVQRLVQIRRRWERERPANFAALPAARRRQLQDRFQSGVRDEIRQLSARVQRNNRRGMLEVRSVLTAQQRVSLRRYLDENAPSGDEPLNLDLTAPDR